jgi:hypothetical protein
LLCAVLGAPELGPAPALNAAGLERAAGASAALLAALDAITCRLKRKRGLSLKYQDAEKKKERSVSKKAIGI